MSPITIFRIPERGFQTHNNIYSIHRSIQDTMIMKYYHEYIHHDQWNTSLLQSNKGYLSFISYRIMRENLSLLSQTCVQRPFGPGFTWSRANERRWNGSIPYPWNGTISSLPTIMFEGLVSFPFLEGFQLTEFVHHTIPSPRCHKTRFRDLTSHVMITCSRSCTNKGTHTHTKLKNKREQKLKTNL